MITRKETTITVTFTLVGGDQFTIADTEESKDGTTAWNDFLNGKGFACKPEGSDEPIYFPYHAILAAAPSIETSEEQKIDQFCGDGQVDDEPQDYPTE